MTIIDNDKNKKLVLKHFLEICSFEGFSNESLRRSLELANIDEKYQEIIFEDGLFDLIDFYVESKNLEAAKKYDDLDVNFKIKIRDKIRYMLYQRFIVEENNKTALQAMGNFFVNPKNLCEIEFGLKPVSYLFILSYKISDFVWFKIGDSSTDYNFYTKRLTLAKIIFRSFIKFINDDSRDFVNIKNFIDLEIEKVMKFEKFKAKSKNFINDLVLNESGIIKSPKEFLEDLPFIRLINKKNK